MKKITALCFCLALWNSAAAQQKFYEFLWHGKFGITDADGKEIISPAFTSQENLPFASKFIALTNDAGNAIIINKETGKVEDFDHISEVTFRNEADLLLGNKDGNSFLIDEADDAKRSRMPKYYTTVWQLGEYLVCFTKFNGNTEGTADILRKNDLGIVKENLATKEVYNYKNPDTGKKIFAIRSVKNIDVFDDKFGKITSFSAAENVKGSEVLQLVKSKLRMNISNGEENYSDNMVEPRQYPYYDIVTVNNQRIVYLMTKDSKKTPIFKFNADGYTSYSGEISRPFTIERNRISSHSREDFTKFYISRDTYLPLLPKKYWAEFGLQAATADELVNAKQKISFKTNESLPLINEKFIKTDAWMLNEHSEKNMTVYERQIPGNLAISEPFKVLALVQEGLVTQYVITLQAKTLSGKEDGFWKNITDHFPVFEDKDYFKNFVQNGQFHTQLRGLDEGYHWKTEAGKYTFVYYVKAL